ncbi:cilia- and flagella-associated protein 20 isoform X2 [Physcomitrium patens]|uniref:cilia- and flagella-associated protein 20 isoform X2 n=1 Tax=Physcomitrium patens TaxID=3218 RepID=UPI003CCDB844
MFQNEFQTDFISILYALPRTKPLQIWDAKVKQKKRQSEEEEEKKGEWGSVQMVHDDDLQAAVVEVRGDGRTTSITCPAPSSRTAHLHLAITLPVFVLVVKHLRFFYSYQVEVLDDSGVKRVFRFTNTQNTIRSYGMTSTIIPLQLAEGWNMIQVDLAELVRSQYGTKYIETIRVTINANCRIRQIYFSDQLYEEEELKDEHKFFLPIQLYAWSRTGSAAWCHNMGGVPSWNCTKGRGVS